MRLRLFRGRVWWPRRGVRRRAAVQPDTQAQGQAAGLTGPAGPAATRPGALRGSHRKAGRPVTASGAPRPPRPPRPASAAWAADQIRAADTPTGGPTAIGRAHSLGRPDTAGRAPAAARAAIRLAPDALDQAIPAAAKPGTPSATQARHAGAARQAASRAVSQARSHARADGQPWYATARPARTSAGERNCGCLEDVLVREWAADQEPVPEAVTAINRLAALPLLIKEKLAAGLDAIHVGAGGVPDLDHMGELAGVPLPSGRATWDACAGAYGDRKIVVGSRPSPTPDVMCHEIGHALDDIDGSAGSWQSDSDEFRALHGRCLPHLASDFHRHGETLGRREFFADAFAAIASSQRPALVEMLSGDTRTALDVMLYFNVRYGM
jgi:hypothetical protein